MSHNEAALATDLVVMALTVGAGIAARDVDLATRYIARSNFIQHNLQCADGIEGFRAFIAALPSEKGVLTAVRAFRDGQFVVTHSEGDIFGPKAFFDIYRFEDGTIVEHWDNLTDMTPPNASGRTPLDGPTAPTDLANTETNKALVREFFEAAFIDGRLADMADWFDEGRLIQHNASGQDGFAALTQMMQERTAAGQAMTAGRIEQVLGEGDFVLVTASGTVAGEKVAFFDLFRVESRKIAEHWDVVQQVPPRAEWRNGNGKF